MSDATLPSFARRVPGGIEIRLKVVPGASRSAIVGALGDRLKLRVAAPPAAGEANREVADLLGGWLGTSRIELIAGHRQALKTVFARGLAALPALPAAH
jgi:uncharacterized protein (TIGR00251 family)